MNKEVSLITVGNFLVKFCPLLDKHLYGTTDAIYVVWIQWNYCSVLPTTGSKVICYGRPM